MAMVIILLIVIAVVLCSRYAAHGKVQIKSFLTILPFFMAAAALVLLMMKLQHSAENCTVSITIDNHYSPTEIAVEGGDVYYLAENEKLEITDLYPDGALVVKTMNGAKFIEFVDSRHLFSFNHHFTVVINHDDIAIENDSPLLIEISAIAGE